MSDEAELIEAATRAYIDATTNGLCTDRWPRACEDCDCFRDGNAGPGCDAFTRERRIIGHAVAPLLAALAAAREDNDDLRDEAERLRASRDKRRDITVRAIRERDAARVEVTQLQARINRARSVLLNGTDEAGGRVFVAHSILAEPLGSTPDQPATEEKP